MGGVTIHERANCVVSQGLVNTMTICRPTGSVLWVAVGLMVAIASCKPLAQRNPESQALAEENPVTNVDVAIAQTGALENPPEYIGTTEPIRQVQLRARVEGQLLSLNVDVGDRVVEGQPIAQLDDTLLAAAVAQAEADLAAQDAAVVEAQTSLDEARTLVEQTRLQWEQAKRDAQRLLTLQRDGAIALQVAETAETTARTTEQTFRAAQAQVQTRTQTITARQRQVDSQRKALAQAQALQSYGRIVSPLTGTVIARNAEPGDLIEAGDPVVQLGDFRTVKVLIQIGERELGAIALGDRFEVRLDALPQQTLMGTLSRIAPSADPGSRLVPVEITLPNDEGAIGGGGLLARVRPTADGGEPILVPESALQVGNPQSGNSTLFVASGTGSQRTVSARAVQLGRERKGKVEVISGIDAGEPIVIRSSKPLQDRAIVFLSVLSEGAQTEGSEEVGTQDPQKGADGPGTSRN